MNRKGQYDAIGIRGSRVALLILTVLVQFQTSMAQSNSVYESDVHSADIHSVPSESFENNHPRAPVGPGLNRYTGCDNRLGNRYSLQAQTEMGQSYARRVEVSSRFITDPLVSEYVNRIGRNLASSSHAQVELSFKIINTDDVNAFSLPGGFIFVNSGLILAVDDESELAGVISHEIAHVVECHPVQEMIRLDMTSTSPVPLVARLLFRRAIQNTVYLQPMHKFEMEADLLAVDFLYQAGYDPQALSRFLEKVQAMEGQRRNQGRESYPKVIDRIKKVQREIDTMLPPMSEYKLDSSEFQEIRKRLVDLKKSKNADRIQRVRN